MLRRQLGPARGSSQEVIGVLLLDLGDEIVLDSLVNLRDKLQSGVVSSVRTSTELAFSSSLAPSEKRRACPSRIIFPACDCQFLMNS